MKKTAILFIIASLLFSFGRAHIAIGQGLGGGLGTMPAPAIYPSADCLGGNFTQFTAATLAWSCASASASGLIWGNSPMPYWVGISPANATTYYETFAGAQNATSSPDVRSYVVIPQACSVTKFYVLAGNRGTLGATYSGNVTITVMINHSGSLSAGNNVITGLLWQTATPTVFSDTSHSTSFAAGDLLAYRIVTPATWTTPPTTVDLIPAIVCQ